MVKRVFTFVYKEIKGLHQAASILALFAVGSQILAIVRDRLLAHTFGAGTDLDIYYAAFRVPDLLYVLFASVLSVYVLLPFVDRQVAELDEKHSNIKVLSQIFTLFLFVYSGVAGALAVLAPWYVPVVFPGFVGEYEQLITLLQILLLQPFLLGLSSLCGVVTQMNSRFVLYAISPLLYNLGIILGIIWFYPIFGLTGLALGVVLGAFGHLLVQVPFVLKSHYRFGVTRNIELALIKEVLKVSIPRALTLSVNQLVLLVLVSLASVMVVGSVSVFQLGFNLQSVPLAIIGMSYSVAAFPALSNLSAKRDTEGFNRQLLTAIRHIIFWAIPIIGLVIVLRAHIVRVVLGSGAFDWDDTRLTAAVLALFSLSLVAQALLLLMVRAFYASGRTFLPLIASLAGGFTSVGLAFVFRLLYQDHSGLQQAFDGLLRLKGVDGAEVLVLALAFAIGQFVQLIILINASKKSFMIKYNCVNRVFGHSLLASVCGALATYAVLVFVVDGINQKTFMGILLQGGVAGTVGLITIIAIYAACRTDELHELYRSLQGRFGRKNLLAPQNE